MKRVRPELGSYQRPRVVSDVTTCVACRGTSFWSLWVDPRTGETTSGVGPGEHRWLTICEDCSAHYDTGGAK